MYKCQNCNKKSQPKEPRNLVVVATRAKIYSNPDEEGTLIRTSGIETVQEVGVCNECKRRYDEIHSK